MIKMCVFKTMVIIAGNKNVKQLRNEFMPENISILQ